MNQAIRKLSGLLVLPVLLAALLLMPVKAHAAAYECTAELPVTVKLNGDYDEYFEVTITADDESYPMPEQTTLKIKDNRGGCFTGFYYTEPGDYTYTVREKTGDTEYMYYDDVVYTVVIQVTNAEDGGLTYQVYANRDDNPEEKTDSLTFLNTYTPPAPAVTPKPTATPAPVAPTATPTGAFTLPQTGDTMPLITVLVVMLVAAAALVVLFVARKRKNNGK